MLKGFLKYNVEPVAYTAPIQKHWPKAFCESQIKHLKNLGYKIGAKAFTKYGNTPVEIVGYADVPASGIHWSISEPCLLRAKNNFNCIIPYNQSELTLVDTETGEIKC